MEKSRLDKGDQPQADNLLVEALDHEQDSAGALDGFEAASDGLEQPLEPLPGQG